MILEGTSRILILAAFFGLAGCATTEPVIRTVEVLVPYPVSCVPETLDPKPEYPDTDAALAAEPDYAVMIGMVFAGRSLRDSRLADLEGVVEGCRQ